MWFVFSLAATLGWGFADIFYKAGSESSEKDSHLKITVWVGLVMGICSAGLLPFCETAFSLSGFLTSTVRYFPASLGYILSMVIGYAGLRYLEVSVVSPVQNASGAFSAVAMLVYFIAVGRISDLSDAVSPLETAATVIIIIGVVGIAVAEQRLSKKEIAKSGENKKYRYGAFALIFPLLYCLFDTLGTAADGIILDENSGMGLGEKDVLVIYGFTFFAAAVIAYAVLLIRNRRPYNPFEPKEMRVKGAAAVCEQTGQVFYVYAMAARPMLAAPVIASYCIVSVLLSRLLLKERLKPSQSISVTAVIIGIVLLGISEGFAAA